MNTRYIKLYELHNKHVYFKKLLIGLMITVAAFFAMGRIALAYDEVVIVIDPGHGGPVTDDNSDTNAGAMYHDLMEKDINLITARALKEELEQYGNVIVYLTRDEDKEMSLDERVAFAKSVEADFIVSVHYNASGDHNLFGSEIFTSAFDEYYAKGYALAKCVIDEWKEYGNTIKDIKTRIGNSGDDYYGIIRIAKTEEIPAVILEHGYIDNDHDYLRLKSEDSWKQMGQLDARAIAKYYGLEKNLVKEHIKPTVEIPIPSEPVQPDDSGPEDVELTINDYDSNSGEVTFTLHAHDNESRLMYYGFVTDEDVTDDTVFPELELWDESGDYLNGSYHVGVGYTGPITASVFNVYQVNSISNTEILELSKEKVEAPAGDSSEDGDDKELQDGDSSTNSELADDSHDKETDSQSSDIEAGDAITGDEVTSSNEDSFVIGDDKRDDEAIKKALAEESISSTVEDSYKKLAKIVLIISVTLLVALIIAVANAISKSNKKKRYIKKHTQRKSYDWMDED